MDRIKKQLKELWNCVKDVYVQEEHTPNEPNSIEAIDLEEVAKTVERIN